MEAKPPARRKVSRRDRRLLISLSLSDLLLCLLLSSLSFSDRRIDPDDSILLFNLPYSPLYSSFFCILSLLSFLLDFSPSSGLQHTFRSLLGRWIRDVQSSSHQRCLVKYSKDKSKSTTKLSSRRVNTRVWLLERRRERGRLERRRKHRWKSSSES